MSDPFPLEDAIGTRELTFTRSDGIVERVIVAIVAPVQVEDDFWHCSYIIKSESFTKQFRMAGGDSMQALIHAVQVIAVELDALARKHNGTFRFFDEPDTMFPSSSQVNGNPDGHKA